MSDEISLLPENQRGKEEELKKHEPKPEPPKPEELKFSVPADEGEEVEVIEVDEGELDQILANEPPLTRFVYKATAFLQGLKDKLFKPQPIAPPPKAPPQFFKPPEKKTGMAPLGAPVPPMGAALPAKPPMAPAGMAPAAPAKPKARITPSATAPHRVRIIKRVRKPLHVSFVSEEELRMLHIDVAKRRFTFATAAVLFLILLGGSYALLRYQLTGADASKQEAQDQLTQVQQDIASKQKQWSDFQDLEPRLVALNQLLDQHVSPTHLLQLIESHTLPDVAYNSFSLTSDGTLSLGVKARSIESAAGQVSVFQHADFITSVQAPNYAMQYSTSTNDATNVDFQLSLTLNDLALRASTSTVAVSP